MTTLALLPRLALLALILGAIGVYLALDAGAYLNLETFLAHRQRLLDYTRDHYWGVLAVTAALYAAMTALSIPGGSLRSLVIGFLFGHWAGTVIIVFAATAGATLAFLSARYVFAQAVQRRVGARGAKLMHGFAVHAFQYLLFLRLVPLFPFWVVNLAPGLTPIRVRVFIGATVIGIVPASFIAASVGHMFALGEPIRDLAALEQALITHPLAMAAALIGVAAVSWVLVMRYRLFKEAKSR